MMFYGVLCVILLAGNVQGQNNAPQIEIVEEYLAEMPPTVEEGFIAVRETKLY